MDLEVNSTKRDNKLKHKKNNRRTINYWEKYSTFAHKFHVAVLI